MSTLLFCLHHLHVTTSLVFRHMKSASLILDNKRGYEYLTLQTINLNVLISFCVNKVDHHKDSWRDSNLIVAKFVTTNTRILFY